MKDIAQKLDDLIRGRKLTKVELAANVGLTSQTIANILNGSDVKVSSIQKIAAYFGVPVGYFLDKEEKGNSAIVTGNGNAIVNGDHNKLEVAKCQDELEDARIELSHAKQLLKEKDKQLEEKERLINILLKK